MKKLVIALLVMVATSAVGADYLERALYWCNHNGHPCTVPSEVLNIAGTKGALSYICWGAESWKFANPPSKADLDALDEATVDAWVAAQKAEGEAEAIYDGDTGVLLQAFAVELKKVNSGMNLPSKANVIAKYKALKGE